MKRGERGRERPVQLKPIDTAEHESILEEYIGGDDRESRLAGASGAQRCTKLADDRRAHCGHAAQIEDHPAMTVRDRLTDLVVQLGDGI